VKKDVAISLYNSCIRKLNERKEEDENEVKGRRGRKSNKNINEMRTEESMHHGDE